MKNTTKKLGLWIVLVLFSVVSCSVFTDEEKVEEKKVDKLLFNDQKKTVLIGIENTILVSAEPVEATNTKIVSYTSTQPEIVEILTTSNNGIVVRGKKSGSATVIAKVDAQTAYCQITVQGNPESVSPYIKVTQPVIELKKGNTKSLSVSIVGGTVESNNKFTFTSKNEEVVHIESTANTVVLEGKNKGTAKILITNQECESTSELLVFVYDTELPPTYITCDQNVIPILSQQTEQLNCSLVGGTPLDEGLFTYTVKLGTDIISVLGSNNTCSITPKKNGKAVIQVTHPKAANTLHIVVEVIIPVDTNVITVNKEFVLLSGDMADYITASVTDDEKRQYDGLFSYTIDDDSIATVIQTGNNFYVSSKKEGMTVLHIKNEKALFEKEVLIAVERKTPIHFDYYISTSQNIIQLEEGKSIPLSMNLVGGTEADKNNFTWLVEDSSIVELLASDGTVTYARSLADELATSYTSKALVTAKKTGSTTVQVKHPKSSVSQNVIIHVFPKGTFLDTFAILHADTPLVKVEKGGSTPVTLKIANNNSVDIGSVSWKSAMPAIAEIAGSQLEGVATGITSGITDYTVTGEYIEPFTGKILSGTKEELASKKILYANSYVFTIGEDQTMYYTIESNNDLLKYSTAYTAVIEDSSIVSAQMIGNTLYMKGLQLGETNIEVRNPEAENSVRLHVLVNSKEITVEKPYSISGTNFLGVVKGSIEYGSVTLASAPVEQLADLRYESADTSIVTCIGSGNEFSISGIKSGQTELYVTHPKARNEKKIVVFCANTLEELQKMIVLSPEKSNYLLTVKQTALLSVLTNCTDMQKRDIEWTSSDTSIVSVESSQDTCFIKAISPGNAYITVKHPLSVEHKIFISVSETGQIEKQIQCDSICEMVMGTTKILEVAVYGFTETEKNQLTWESGNDAIVSVSKNGTKGYIQAHTAGQTFITVKHTGMAIEKKILVVVAKTYEELKSSYYMYIDKSLIKGKIGDEIDVSVQYGTKKLPELEKLNFNWKVDTNESAVTVIPNRDKATVRLLKEGVVRMSVTHPVLATPIQIEAVIEKSIAEKEYTITAITIKGMLVGQETTLSATLLDDTGKEKTNAYSQMTFEIEKPDVLELAANENMGFAKALKSGTTYVTIRHPLAKEAKRILVYVEETAEQLEQVYPVGVDKDSYLLKVGEEVIISVITKDTNPTAISQITWSSSGSAFVVENISKTQARVRAKSSGSGLITINHPKAKTPAYVYIGVQDKTIATNTEIATESIIQLITGTTKTTKLSSNVREEDKSLIVWKSGQENIATVTGNKDSALITAVKSGDAYIEVSYGAMTRYILVIVRDTQQELDESVSMFLDKRQYVVKKGEKVSISPVFLAKAPPAGTVLQCTDTLKNNVATFEIEQNRIIFTAINEGVGVYTLSHTGVSQIIPIYIEVQDIHTPPTSEVNKRYIGLDKNVYVVSMEESLKGVTFRPLFFNFAEQEIIQTKVVNKNPDIVSSYITNGMITVLPIKEGKAVLSIENPYSLNKIDAVIIVGDAVQYDTDTVSYAYIAPSASTVSLMTGEEYVLTATIKNKEQYNNALFTWSLSADSSVSVTQFGDSFKVVGLKEGQTVLTLSHPDCTYKKHVLIAVANPLVKPVFMTTVQNFIPLKKGGYGTLQVELKNAVDYDASNFVYTSENPSICTVSGSGLQATVTAVNTGVARIKVVYKKSPYPLYITVSVQDEIKEKPVYISSLLPVFTISDGESQTVSVVLNNGEESEQPLFSWSNKTTNVIQVINSGNYAVVKGLCPGVGRIVVTHPSSLNSIEIAVVVEEKKSESDVYISTNDLIVNLKPQDQAKQVSVRLSSGKAEDIYGFIWQVYSSESTVKNNDGTSKPVISLVGNADQAFIKPINEGVAVIRVSHPKTSYKLDIKAVVTLYTDLRFENISTSVDQNATTQVKVTAPTGETVIYESSDDSVATVTGTNSICIIEGHKAGTAIITGRTASGGAYNTVMVKVNPVDNAKVVYISLPTNIITLETQGSSVSVNAELLGDGVTQDMQSGITWSLSDISSVTSNSIVSLLGTAGKTCAITPKGIGDTVVYVHHKDATTTTKKKLYVKVTESLYRFTLNQFQQITVGQTSTLTATIEGANVDYSKMNWSIKSDDESISIVSMNANQITIKAQKAGSATVLASYLGSTKSCEVRVIDQPLLTAPSGITIVPNETYSIVYTHKPENAVITATLDSQNFASIVSHNQTTNTIVIQGNGDSGTTMLTLKDDANKLSTVSTIYTNFNYLLYANVSQLNCAPNSVQTFMVHVNPSSSTMRYELKNKTLNTTIETENTYPAKYVQITGTGSARTITLTVPKTGEYELIVASVMGGKVQKTITIPVYCYYENFTIPDPIVVLQNGATKTTTDVIHLKQGAKISINVIQPILDAYPNMHVTMIGGGITNALINIVCKTGGNVVTVENTLPQTAWTTISKSEYSGIISIRYKVYTNAGFIEKSKNFVVYKDTVIQ